MTGLGAEQAAWWGQNAKACSACHMKLHAKHNTHIVLMPSP
jgi:hypothetical protein